MRLSAGTDTFAPRHRAREVEHTLHEEGDAPLRGAGRARRGQRPRRRHFFVRLRPDGPARDEVAAQHHRRPPGHGRLVLLHPLQTGATFSDGVLR